MPVKVIKVKLPNENNIQKTEVQFTNLLKLKELLNLANPRNVLQCVLMLQEWHKYLNRKPQACKQLLLRLNKCY